MIDILKDLYTNNRGIFFALFFLFGIFSCINAYVKKREREDRPLGERFDWLFILIFVILTPIFIYLGIRYDNWKKSLEERTQRIQLQIDELERRAAENADHN